MVGIGVGSERVGQGIVQAGCEILVAVKASDRLLGSSQLGLDIRVHALAADVATSPGLPLGQLLRQAVRTSYLSPLGFLVLGAAMPSRQVHHRGRHVVAGGGLARPRTWTAGPSRRVVRRR